MDLQYAQLNSRQSFFVIIAGLLALVLYWLTMAPDLVWQDQGDYQVQVAQLTMRIPGDVVRVHPLYIVIAHCLGRITPFGYAWAANFTSAIFAAVGISGLASLMIVLTGRILPAIITAGVCGFGHTYWFMATQAQTYSLSNAITIWGLFFIVLYCQRQQKKYLYLACFIFGLGVSVHNMSQIAFVVLAGYLAYCFLRKRISVAALGGCVLAWLLGGSLWLYVIALEYQATGELIAAVQSAIYGRWGRAVFNAGGMIHLFIRSMQFLVLNFPTPLVLLALPGIWFSRRIFCRDVSIILLASLVLYILFAFRYDVPNQNNFFMPAYILLCVYIGLGWHYLQPKFRPIVAMTGIILILLMVPTYAGLSYAAQSRGVQWGSNFRHIPYRQEYQYYLEPWQHCQTGPRTMVTEIFRVLPDNAILVVDSTPYSAFEYAQKVEKQRTDVMLVDLDYFKSVDIVGRRVYFLMDIDLYRRQVDPSAEFEPVDLTDGQRIFEVKGALKGDGFINGSN